MLLAFALSAALPQLAQAIVPNVFQVTDVYSFDPLEHLAGIAPYFDPLDPAKDPSPPQGCNVTRAAYLVRHAAIYANDFDYEEYIQPFVEKLGNTSVNWSQAPDLSFLSSWKTPIEDSDQEQLTKVGEIESERLGIELSQRYPTFRSPQKVWSSTAERTTRSAQSLIEGLAKQENETSLVEINEGKKEGANSLTPYQSCPGYSSSRGSRDADMTVFGPQAFQKRYTRPIIARFNAQASGFNFTANDVYGMQQLCGYETVVRGSSPFCNLDLFTPDEWLAFEYTNDIMYHHNIGYGNELSGVIGLPWANATANLLLANTTDQDLYVSFTHRELPPTVLVAMGLFNNSAFTGANNVNATMPTDAINYHRSWISSDILPFLTNIAVEKMVCDSYGYEDNTDGEFYRVLVNSSPQPLVGCTDGPAESCSREGFQQWLGGRQDTFSGFSQKCGVTYSNSTDTLSIYS
ncbi:MAG: hypothetical protein M1819_005226 [Sarea resinae]|nr:MAG: hypothetical protein M1819_005226 [Sarea resinae]